MATSLPSAPPAACKRVPYHPLELIPFFARWAPTPWRDIVYTAIFNVIMAVIFTALNLLFGEVPSLARAFGICMVFSQCIGFTIYGLIRLADSVLFRHRDGALARWVTFVLIPMVGAYIGYLIATWLMGWSQQRADLFTWRGTLSVLTVAAIITAVLVLIFLPRERAARAEARAARDEARVSAAERETTLARMQLLEAQVEPHFLYNTLAHVMSLVDTEPPLAKRMLHRLIDLLRATALSGQAEGTVRSQVALLGAYLDLIGLRMGSRMAWSIDVAPGLEGQAIAPMLLQPLVENAIKHGLEPRIEGGRVDVTVRRDGPYLHLTVADTGLGVAPTRDPTSTGLGLVNLRARLAAVYGNAASLTLTDNVPQGTIVTIELPVEDGT